MTDKNNNHEKLAEEDILLFRRAMKNIRPLNKPQERVLLKKKAIHANKKPIEPKAEDNFPYLSDHSNQAVVTQEQLLFFTRPGISAKQIKKLKQGKIRLEAQLDLHGYDVASARSELSAFLSSAYQRNIRYVIIIHGKGHSEQPILKNKINVWLRQLEFVLAFCSAPPKHGGAGATYVLLKAQR